MEKTNIAKELRLMADMVESWNEADISEIEKDTVLAGLREVYNDIKYCGRAADTAVLSPEGEGTSAPAAGAAVEGTDAKKPAESTIAENCEASVDTSPENFPENTPHPPVPSPAPEIAAEVADPVNAAEADEPTPDYDIDITEVPAAVEVSAADSSFIVNSQDEKEEFRDSILFDEGEIPAKPKLDKRAILSLYGDDPAPAPISSGQEPRPTPIPAGQEPRPAVTNLNEVYNEEPVYTAPVAESAAQVIPGAGDTEPVQVLGDVLGNGAQTVSDMYCGNGEVTDVASVVGSGRVDSIRKAIGINDKFLLIRNLFDGNADLYENTITALDGFSDLDEALIYIHENFHWNPDSDAVKLLVDVLTRKLS